jgi:hypothetical protein
MSANALSLPELPRRRRIAASFTLRDEQVIGEGGIAQTLHHESTRVALAALAPNREIQPASSLTGLRLELHS